MKIKKRYFLFMKTWGFDLLPIFEEGKHYYFICKLFVLSFLSLVIFSVIINSISCIHELVLGIRRVALELRFEKTLMPILACQLSSTLMQILFLFDRGVRVVITLM